MTPKYHKNVVEKRYLSHALHLTNCRLEIVKNNTFWIKLVPFDTKLFFFPYGS